MFAVVNIERLHDAELLAINFYKGDKDDDNGPGYLVDQVIRPFSGYEQAINLLKTAGVTHVWTSNRDLFGLLIQTPGIGAEVKHESDTGCTRRAVEQYAGILMGLLDINEIEPVEIAKWRRWLCDQLKKMIRIIGGKNYDSRK